MFKNTWLLTKWGLEAVSCYKKLSWCKRTVQCKIGAVYVIVVDAPSNTVLPCKHRLIFRKKFASDCTQLLWWKLAIWWQTEFCIAIGLTLLPTSLRGSFYFKSSLSLCNQIVFVVRRCHLWATSRIMHWRGTICLFARRAFQWNDFVQLQQSAQNDSCSRGQGMLLPVHRGYVWTEQVYWNGSY